jgi:hypothetical protein
MLSGWRIGRMLLKKKTWFLSKIGSFIFDGLGSINARCNVGIF